MCTQEVTGGWKKLHLEELHNLYSSQNIIRIVKSRRMRWAGHVTHTGEMRHAHKILLGRSEVNRPLVKHKRRYEDEDNIKMDFKEMRRERLDWIHVLQDIIQWRTFLNTLVNFGFHRRQSIS
jgi:hypothetical protein